MPTFAYRAADRRGRTVEGRIEGADLEAASARLRAMDVFPLQVRPVGDQARGGGGARAGKGKARSLVAFTQQLAMLLQAGITLDQALGISADVSPDPLFRATVAQVHRAVQEGSSLSEALERHPRVFPELYVGMVRAGEAGGAMDQILARLAQFLEEWQRLKEVVVSALLYPAFLTVFAVSAVGLLFALVVPRFTQVFEDMGSKLPASTRMLMTVSDLVRNSWWAIAAGAAALVGIGVALARDPRVRAWWDAQVLSVPVLGGLVAKIQVSRFARVFGTLTQSGVPILKALEITSGTLTNGVFVRSLARVQSGLREGQGVAEPLRRAGVFPPLFLHMVAVGEETGRIEEMMLLVATGYDRDVETTVKRLLSLLEPVIILVMGSMIGAVILSILYAIFSVNQMAF